MLHIPCELGSNLCSVGAPVVLSDGLLGFLPLEATIICSITLLSPHPSIVLNVPQHPSLKNLIPSSDLSSQTMRLIMLFSMLSALIMMQGTVPPPLVIAGAIPLVS